MKLDKPIGLILVFSLMAMATALPAAFGQDGQSGSAERTAMKRKYWKGLGVLTEQSIESQGVVRKYLLYRPHCKLNYPAPVVLAFHGGGGTARSMDKLTGGITELADKEGFVVVFPDGVKRSWNDGRVETRKHDLDDVQFVSAMCDKLISDGVADGKRIYATGISNGGFFSQYLAMRLAGRIAAVASVAATLPEFDVNLMPHKPIAMMYILGVEDPLVPFDGGKIGGKVLLKSRGNALSAQRALGVWLNNNGLQASESRLRVIDRNDQDGTRVVRTDFGETGSPAEVSYIVIEGGGHTWPRGWQYLPVAVVGKTSQELDANEVIWDFFKAHHL